MNIKEIIHNIKKIDNKIYNIMENGIKFSFVFCLLASYILVTYFETLNPSTYDIGFSLFKSGLFFLCTFIMCAFAFNKIIKDIK